MYVVQSFIKGHRKSGVLIELAHLEWNMHVCLCKVYLKATIISVYLFS